MATKDCVDINNAVCRYRNNRIIVTIHFFFVLSPNSLQITYMCDIIFSFNYCKTNEFCRNFILISAFLYICM